jgi:hypothetical protein
MNRYQLMHQFGKNPDIVAVLVWATQQALKAYGKTHPDYKRQRCNRQRDLMLWGARKIKRAVHDERSYY